MARLRLGARAFDDLGHDRVVNIGPDAKVALVTGGAKRIGASICRNLATAGYRVVIHTNTSVAEAEKLADEIHGAVVVANLTDAEAVERLLPAAAAAAGEPISFVVNNASAFPKQELQDVQPADFDTMMRLHTWAPLVISRMAAESGAQAVVNILDTRVSSQDPAHFAYHLSKQTLASLTRNLAAQLAPMRVNGVAPGPILAPTDGSDDSLDPAIAATKLGRAGTPAEVAHAVRFMLEATYTTGDVLFVDGGRHLA